MLALLPFLLVGALAAPAPATSDSIPISDNVLQFSAKHAVSSSRHAQKQAAYDHLRSLAAGKKVHTKRFGPTSASLTLSPGGSDYSVPVTIGGKPFNVIVDTGSSDLWVASTKYQCYDLSGVPQAQSYCNLNNPSALYNPAQHPGFVPLPFKSNFNVTYGGAQGVVGYAGYETVQVGSLSVPLTEFGVATSGTFFSDGLSVGILGLAAPSLTSVYFGSDPSKDNNNNVAVYPPWFYTAVAQFQVAPYFILLLQRPSLGQEADFSPHANLGSLTLGGRPNVPVTSTSVTVQNHLFKTFIDNTQTYQPQFYTVQVDSFNYPNSNKINTKTPLVVLDSGTTLLLLPDGIVDSFNAQWGNAYYDPNNAAYVVDCKPKIVPYFSVTIGGKTFTLTVQDLVFPGFGLPIGKCISTVVYGGLDQQNGIFFLGDRFLVNVLTTYNIQTNQITITQRQNYTAPVPGSS